VTDEWTGAGEGALGGAAAGAAFGPWGAAIGGVAGGLIGFFGNQGASSYQTPLQQLAAQYGALGGPSAGPAAQVNGNNVFSQGQAGLVSQLQTMASGGGPNLAALQMQQAMDQAVSAQTSLAAGGGGRGVNAGASMRNASNNLAAQQQSAAQTGALGAVQQQLGAISQLGGVLQGANAQQLQAQEFNAQAQNTTSLANLQAKLAAMGLSEQGQLQALQMAMQAAGPGMGAQVMAGGAMAMPGLMKAYGPQPGGGYGQGLNQYANGYNPAQGPVLSPGQAGGPVTSPGDV